MSGVRLSTRFTQRGRFYRCQPSSGLGDASETLGGPTSKSVDVLDEFLRLPWLNGSGLVFQEVLRANDLLASCAWATREGRGAVAARPRFRGRRLGTGCLSSRRPGHPTPISLHVRRKRPRHSSRPGPPLSACRRQILWTFSNRCGLWFALRQRFSRQPTQQHAALALDALYQACSALAIVLFGRVHKGGEGVAESGPDVLLQGF